MGAVGSVKVKSLLGKSLNAYDSRFSQDIQSAADEIHKEFPQILEITSINASDGINAAASMNGMGTLTINSKLLQDYDDGIVQTLPPGWSAGDGTFKNSMIAHELAHNLDSKFTNMLADYSPQIMDSKSITMVNDLWAEAYSKALGKELKPGDVVSNVIPAYDTSAKIMTIDGTKYSSDDVYAKGGNLSDIVVPKAIENIHNNWIALGYKTKPTTSQLISNLSGYVNNTYPQGHKNFNTEVFAESYSSYKSYGKDANPLAQEVMRLTKQAYNSATSNKKNGVMDFYQKLFKAQAEVKKKHGIG